jgi:hypothetical protein
MKHPAGKNKENKTEHRQPPTNRDLSLGSGWLVVGGALFCFPCSSQLRLRDCESDVAVGSRRSRCGRLHGPRRGRSEQPLGLRMTPLMRPLPKRTPLMRLGWRSCRRSTARTSTIERLFLCLSRAAQIYSTFAFIIAGAGQRRGAFECLCAHSVSWLPAFTAHPTLGVASSQRRGPSGPMCLVFVCAFAAHQP